MSDFLDTIQHLFAVMVSSMYTAMPGKIDTYNFKLQKASVKPLLKKKFVDGITEAQPIITDVPVIFPRSKSSGMTFPLKKGDGVLLVFAGRDISQFLGTGEDSAPEDPRKFDISDAVAIPGLFSFIQKNIASNNENFEIHHESQKVTIKENGDIEIGTSSLKKLVNDSFQSLFNNHGHDYISPGGPAISGTPVTGIVPTSVPTPITPLELTSKVVAE